MQKKFKPGEQRPIGVEYDKNDKLVKAKTPRGGLAVMCAYCGNGIVVLKDHKKNCVIWDVI